MEHQQLNSVCDVTHRLLDYCAANDWAGYDPYDALNSRLFRALPFLDFKAFRLGLTQTLKRSPINFRAILLVPKTHNPKGMALFLSALVKFHRSGFASLETELRRVANRLLELRSTDRGYSTWGYSFDWQTRTKLIPRGSPNIICTTFAANALLDAYQLTQEPGYAEAALSAAQYVLGSLYKIVGEDAWFNYTPIEITQIHNANLLGAALLSRCARVLSQEQFFEPAFRAARFSTARQNADGSWYYGERTQPSQKWIDNFHTGFNLCALRTIADCGQTNEFDRSIGHGLTYFLDNFFESDGAPKYFHNKTYPIDIHSAAQAIVTLTALSPFNDRCNFTANAVLKWTLENFWSGSYFYYQKHKYFTNRIPYIRWSQAWMLLALASVVDSTKRLNQASDDAIALPIGSSLA